MPFIQFQHRRDTAALWTSNNPTLASGEMGLETDTSLFKIGNGTTAWNSLPYGGLRGATGATGGGGGSSGLTYLNPIAIGVDAGFTGQQVDAIAIGYRAGYTSQQGHAVAIGNFAGYTGQQNTAIAMGYAAGFVSQQGSAIAIGYQAGFTGQQANAIAIGAGAGYTGQAAKTIILNATGLTGVTGVSGQTDSFYVAPVRASTSSYVLGYNPSTFEVTYAIPTASGATGGTGATGATASVSVGTVTTLAPGSTATVTNSGTTYASILNFGIPQGPTGGGATGATGATGVTGGISFSGPTGSVLYYDGTYATGSSFFSFNPASGATGEVTIAGKLTVLGGIDPLYLNLVPTTVNPFPGITGTLWVNASGELYYDNAEVTVGGGTGGVDLTTLNPIAIGVGAGFTGQHLNAIAIGVSAGYTGQESSTIAIGLQAGITGQKGSAIAIGGQAGALNQQNSAIAIGNQAGQLTQGQNAIAIGNAAGYTGQESLTVAIGRGAGEGFQQTQAVAIGYLAGAAYQQSNAVAIGTQAGYTGQGGSAVAIGSYAGSNSQLGYAIAIGEYAGNTGQQDYAIAIGLNAGNSGQNPNAVAIGQNAGYEGQGEYAVAIGSNAAYTGQQNFAVAIGYQAGNTGQQDYAVAIGYRAGNTGQQTNAVAIGQGAGYEGQGDSAVAIGLNAGFTGQQNYSIAIGNIAGNDGQGEYAVAIGNGAGYTGQQDYAIALGFNAGLGGQGGYAVAIGTQAGNTGQQTNAVAIGNLAGYENQGNYSVAIGFGAGQSNQPAKTIILNASGASVDGVSGQTEAFYVTPVRASTSSYVLGYNPSTFEVTYDALTAGGSTGATGATGGISFSGETGAFLYYDGSGVTGTAGLTYDAVSSTIYLPPSTIIVAPGGSPLQVQGSLQVTDDLYLDRFLLDENGGTGTTGQVLSSTATGTMWIDMTGGGGGSVLGFSNVLYVDGLSGNDSTAITGGTPYQTVNAAVDNAVSGQLVWVMPGTYNLTAGLTLIDGVSIRGASVQSTTIQMEGVTGDTTLLTMTGNNRVEDVTLRLQSNEHHTLKGIVFTGNSTKTAKLRTAVLTVDNHSAGYLGISNVYGVEANGQGTTYDIQNFSYNSLKGSTINVTSDGGGDKRGILVSGYNSISTRDINIYVARPATPGATAIDGPGFVGATGSYVGVETNDTSGLSYGSIQMRTSTIGTERKLPWNTYSVSDILQTVPSSVADPTYLASPGIQIGPGVDLVTKSAGGKPFSTYNYPTTLYYGVRGNITSAPSGGYLWLGTQSVSAGAFPDTGLPAAYYRIQQPAILSGLNAACTTGPGITQGTTIQVYYTPISTGVMVPIPNFVAGLSGSSGPVSVSYYNSTQNLDVGDRIHVGVTYSGNSTTNITHDLTVQLDMF